MSNISATDSKTSLFIANSSHGARPSNSSNKRIPQSAQFTKLFISIALSYGHLYIPVACVLKGRDYVVLGYLLPVLLGERVVDIYGNLLGLPGLLFSKILIIKVLLNTYRQINPL
jgi:hypothetical protein